MSMKQDRYEVRAARVQDIPDLVAMRLKLEAHVLERNPVSWEMSAKKIAHMGDYFGREMEHPGSKVLVVQDQESGKVMGMGMGRKFVNDDFIPGVTGRVDDVWIEPEHRRQGLGSRMVSELIRFFESEGIRALTLDYARGNREAAAFWLGLGL
jgi:ribosomal protein S18 acetylase RimI-like enzyme